MHSATYAGSKECQSEPDFDPFCQFLGICLPALNETPAHKFKTHSGQIPRLDTGERKIDVPSSKMSSGCQNVPCYSHVYPCVWAVEKIILSTFHDKTYSRIHPHTKTYALLFQHSTLHLFLFCLFTFIRGNSMIASSHTGISVIYLMTSYRIK